MLSQPFKFPVRTGLISIFLIPVLIYILAAANVRLDMDDFCNINIVGRMGGVVSLHYWYYGWSGRFTSLILMIISFQGGLVVVQLVIALMLGLWWIALMGSIQRVFEILRLPLPFMLSCVFSSLIVLGVLETGPVVFLSVYWPTSAFVYLLPIVLLCVLAWVIVQRRLNNALSIVLVLVVCFLGAGCLELYATMMIVGLVIAVAVSRKRSVIKNRLLAGVVGAILGLGLNLIAPGNYVRMSHFERPEITQILTEIITTLGIPIIEAFAFSPLTVLSLFLFAGFIAYNFDKNRNNSLKQMIIGIPFTVFASTAAYFGPGIYIAGMGLPSRAWIIPEFIVMCGVAAWGYVVGLVVRPVHLRSKLTSPMVLVLVAVVGSAVIFSMSRASAVASRLSTYAAQWDRRDLILREMAGTSEPVIVVPEIDNFGMDGVSTDEDFWANQCLAQYYQVPAVKRAP
ncbi:MAG: hypothetical protein IAE83_06335 [Anaerolinea sp.]|nr:hypothetical protein [Anaerolinea sp.]